MNTSENTIMIIDSEIIKNIIRELQEKGEFERIAYEHSLTFIKSNFDTFLSEYSIELMVQGMKEENLSKKVDLEGYIICFFFEYQKVQVQNRVIKLADELYQSGMFKKFAFENDYSFSVSKFNEFLSSYTFDEMIKKIQKEYELYEGEDGDKSSEITIIDSEITKIRFLK